MVNSSNTSICLLAATALLTASCSDGRSVNNASPRITPIPQQATLGGVTFSIDLSTYVSDRESPTLTYSVISGGGAFADSTYSNMFATMGEYDVEFQVTDGPKTENATFRVEVTSANLVPVTEDGTALMLLDTASNTLKRVTSTSPQPTFVTLAGTRNVVYTLGAGSEAWIYDAYVGQSTQLAPNLEGGASYQAKTSDGKLIYTTGTAPNQTIWFFNPTTTVERNVADGVLSTVTVLVNSSDLVFYEDGVNGQSDIWFYDPSEDQVVAVATEATDEQLLAVLPNGGVVFSRVGSGGELDLFYFRVGAGLVELGTDVPAIASRNKTFQVNDTNSKVVFTALNGANEELYFWNPSNGQTTAIATGVNTTVFSEVGGSNEVVYNVVVSGTEEDASYYDLDDGTTATLRNSTDISEVLAVTNDGSTSWAIVRGSGTLTDILAISLVGTPSTQTWSAGGNAGAGGRVANGDYVAERDDNTALNFFDVSAGTWGTPITGTGLDFQGDGLDAGDFVYVAEVASQNDLLMWDESGATSVTISNTAGDDAWAAKTLNSTILFTRKVGANTTADLFVWDALAETRLTDTGNDNVFHNYSAAGSAFAASRQ